MTNQSPLEGSDIRREGPTEDNDNLDRGNEGKDTGDQPTEADENLDAGGEGPKDTGDEA